MFRRFRNVLWAFLLSGCLVSPLDAQTSEDLFDSGILHTIRLDLNPSDWQALKQRYLENTYYKADMHWTYNGQDIEIRSVGIRSRGSGSRSPVKPAIGIDFTRYNASQRLLGLKAVVLRNNTQDASMMREAVTMAVLRRMGVPASRESYTRLYVNGEYVGLYTIVESIDSVFLKRNFGESDGYLYSVDRISAEDPPFLFEDKGPDASEYMPLPLKPENHSSDPEPEPVVRLIQAINQIPSATFSEAMPEYLNLKHVLTQLAVEAYLAEEDGIAGDYGTNNTYMYRFIGTNQFEFMPWDKSNAFWELNRSVWINTDVNVLLRRALAVPELRAFYRDNLLRITSMSGWIEGEIARVYRQIHSAALEDQYKQCYDADWVMTNCSNDRFEADVAYLSQFARERNNIVVQQLSVNSADFGFSEGAVSLRTGETGSETRAGYAAIEMNAGTSLPAGLSIYSLRRNDVLLSETVARLSSSIKRGQLWAEIDHSVDTGMAIANLSSTRATLSFYFADPTGRRFGEGSTTIEAGTQMSQFLSAPPFNGPPAFYGSFFFVSSVPVSVAAIRGRMNSRAEYIMSALPVLNLDQTPSIPTIIPYFTQGTGWQSEVVLLNPTNGVLSGSIEFWGQGTVASEASPVRVIANGVTGTTFRYELAGEGSGWLHLSDVPEQVYSGTVRIVPDGMPPFSFVSQAYGTVDTTISETIVPAIRPANALNIYTEQYGTLSSAVVIANPSGRADTALLQLRDLSGNRVGSANSLVVPANGQTVFFLNQLTGFSDLPEPFEGLLNVSTASSAGLSAMEIRLRYNERGELLVAVVPGESESISVETSIGFPLIVSGGGFSTHLVLSGNSASPYVSGSVRLRSQSGAPIGLALEETEAQKDLALTPVPQANPVAEGSTAPNILSRELAEIVIAQGSTRLENTSALTSYYGYANDVLAAPPDFPKMVPDPGDTPSPTRKVEATKTDPDKNTYLVLRRSASGADSSYDYGTHFLFQGHELGEDGKGYITRINLDAGARHRVTLMATADVNGTPFPVFDGSMWYPFSEHLLFTAERATGGGVWQATPDFPSTVEDLSGAFGRAGYEGIQADNRGNLIIVEHVGGANGTANPHAKQPNSFVYRFIPSDPEDLRQGGRLQALQVLSKARPGIAIKFGTDADEDILSEDSKDLHTYGLVFQTRWITIHDTETQGSAPFDANAAAKAAGATPFKSPENGQFQPETNFTEFLFTTTGDNDALTEAGTTYGGFGAIFRVTISGSDSGWLTLVYRGDVAHSGFDNCTFWNANQFIVAEDAGDGLHAQRNAFDSAYLLDLKTDYSGGTQPVRILALGRDPSATIDSALRGFAGFQNDGNNEITGIHVSDGDPTIRGLVGTYAPTPFTNGWRFFYTQQHGDNISWEIVRH